MNPTPDDARFDQPQDTFDTVMLCTVSSAGTIHARPMVVAAVDTAHCWWFVAPEDSVTCREIDASADAAITMQGRSSYATLSGRAAVVRGAEAMRAAPVADELDGSIEDDDETAFICFKPTLGAHWPEGETESLPLQIGDAPRLLDREAVDAEAAAAHAETAAS